MAGGAGLVDVETAVKRVPLTRGSVLRRRTGLRRTGRLGLAAAKRRAAGGPRVKGRPALSVEGWKRLKKMLLVRAHQRCEFCGAVRMLDPEHAKPTGQGGADSWANVWIACWLCHNRKTFGTRGDWKLEILPRGDGRFLGSLWMEGKKVHTGEFGRLPTAAEAEVLRTLV